MAEMIPDRLPSSASAGEKRVFELLQKLPDDVIVYYEPVVGERYPDFVVILPSVGLLVIEVVSHPYFGSKPPEGHHKLTGAGRNV